MVHIVTIQNSTYRCRTLHCSSILT